MSRTKLSSLLCLLLAACGGNVVVDGLSGGTGAGAGGSATTGVTNGAGGTLPITTTGIGGGSFGTTGVGASTTTGAGASQGAGAGPGATTTTTTGVGGGTSTGCAGTFFEIVVGNELLQLDSSCTSQSPPLPVPFGQYLFGGVSSNPGSLTIEACQSSASNSLGIVLTAAGATSPGTYMLTGVEALGAMLPALSGTLQLIDVGPVGGTILRLVPARQFHGAGQVHRLPRTGHHRAVTLRLRVR